MTALAYTIRIQRAAITLSAAGSPSTAWADLVTLRAAMVDSVSEEIQRAAGMGDERPVTFRTRYVDGITPADRIHFHGRLYDIKSATMLGRRRGLEIRAVAKGVQ